MSAFHGFGRECRVSDRQEVDPRVWWRICISTALHLILRENPPQVGAEERRHLLELERLTEMWETGTLRRSPQTFIMEPVFDHALGAACPRKEKSAAAGDLRRILYLIGRFSVIRTRRGRYAYAFLAATEEFLADMIREELRQCG